MTLIRNGVSLSANPGRISASATTYYGILRHLRMGAGGMRGFHGSEGTMVAGASVSDTSGRPNGHQGESCWLLPIKGGGLSAYTTFTHPSTLVANLSLGINIESSLVADGSITTADIQALANLVSTMTADTAVSAVMVGVANMLSTMIASHGLSATLSAYANLAATMTADGSLTTAELSLIVGLACTMVSDGSLSTANLTLIVGLACAMVASCTVSADLKAIANIASTMLASGDLSGALSVLSSMIATMTATGGLSGSLRGTLSMEATMTTEGTVDNPPTANEIALAVWSFILSGASTTATAGEALSRITLPVDIPITIRTVVADAGNSVLSFKTDLTEGVSSYWKDALCTFASGALAGQIKRVTSYDGATKVLTVGPSPGYSSAPSPGDTFILLMR